MVRVSQECIPFSRAHCERFVAVLIIQLSFFTMIVDSARPMLETEELLKSRLADIEDVTCGLNQFKCLQLNLNQILSINDWNRRPKECIPQAYRCDGRHDCQDGSDEVECFVQLPRRKTFRCFVGHGRDMSVEDCLLRDRRNPVTDPHETSRSVSEMKEWGCSKLDKPDGTVIRDCTKIYTGGEAFRVCYTNVEDGSTCICSRELCNGQSSSTKPPPALSGTIILMVVVVEMMASMSKLYLGPPSRTVFL